MEARAVRENGLQRGVSDGAFSAWVRNGRVRQRQGRGDMLGRGTCKRWQKSETSKMKAYTGEWVLLRMVWRERIGCAGVSREVKQDGNTCTVVAGCAAASIAEVKLSLVVRMRCWNAMESKKDVAVALSTSGRAISWRRAESKHVLPHARPRKKVCDQRGGGGVREQRRHRHAVWGGKEEMCHSHW